MLSTRIFPNKGGGRPSAENLKSVSRPEGPGCLLGKGTVPVYLQYCTNTHTSVVQCTLGAIGNTAKANQPQKYQTSTINAMVPGRKVALPLEGIVPILL